MKLDVRWYFYGIIALIIFSAWDRHFRDKPTKPLATRTSQYDMEKIDKELCESDGGFYHGSWLGCERD